MTPEERALVLSTAVALVLGVVALLVALATGSGAILLDGAFNLCFFATALVTLHVARLLARPDDQQYPFGYLHFEPCSWASGRRTAWAVRWSQRSPNGTRRSSSTSSSPPSRSSQPPITGFVVDPLVDQACGSTRS